MAVLALLALALTAPGVITNGDFEEGLVGWNSHHPWYARPEGAGLSDVLAAMGDGRDGSTALKILGGGKRGLAMQVRPAYPGRYRVRGWIRSQGLGETGAAILVEWIGRDNKYLTGMRAGGVKGDSDWLAVDTILEAPAETRSVHFDLLTDAPNEGVAWFDEVTMERIPSDGPPPATPSLTAETPAGAEGCLRVVWAPPADGSVVRCLVYAAPDPLDLDALPLPAAVADADAGEVLLRSLANGVTYHVAAVAVDADGRRSALGQAVVAQVLDRQPPRPGWLTASRATGGEGDAAQLRWQPHVLDDDIVRVQFCLPGRNNAMVPVGEPRLLQPPIAGTVLEAELPTAGNRVGVYTEDAAGQRSPVEWVSVLAAPADAAGPWQMWTAPPTAQLPVETRMPEAAGGAAPPPTDFHLMALRGQTVGFQVMVSPDVDVHDVRVEWGAVQSEAGRPVPGLRPDARFVDFMVLDQNSRATPPEGLVWPAPAAYPDALSDEPSRDLGARRLQPIFVRVAVPRDMPAGTYTGEGWVTAHEGRQRFAYHVRVPDAALPDEPALTFVYWYSWAEPCRQFGVEQESEDGWRALRRTAAMMHDYHQNSVVVPWSLIDGWVDDAGEMVCDFSRFDRYVDTFAAEGVDRLFLIGHMGFRGPGGWEAPTFTTADAVLRRLSTGEELRRPATELLPAIQDHLEARGLLERFAVHVADEPIKVNRESWLELSARVKAMAPKLRRIDAIHIPDLRGGIEIWVPQLNYLVQWLEEYHAAVAAARAAGGSDELWFYVAWVPQGEYPNRMIDGPAIKPRVLHWMHYLYGSTGYLHWALNRWSSDLMGLQSPGDTTITWPSRRDIANSSLRYEAERAGLEDQELMRMVEDAYVAQGMDRPAARAKVLGVVNEAVRSATDYTKTWAELEAVRRRLVDELEQP